MHPPDPHIQDYAKAILAAIADEPEGTQATILTYALTELIKGTDPYRQRWLADLCAGQIKGVLYGEITS